MQDLPICRLVEEADLSSRGIDQHIGRTDRTRQRAALAIIRSLVPAAMVLPCRRFQLLIFATLVSKSSAIDDSVSPRLTR